jgi:hypothetical protein
VAVVHHYLVALVELVAVMAAENLQTLQQQPIQQALVLEVEVKVEFHLTSILLHLVLMV